MIKKGYTILGLMAGLILLPACKDEWEAGPEVPSTMGVYFGLQTEYSYLIEPDDNHLLEINLGRADSENEATIPLTAVSCPDGVDVPQSVTFAAGSTTAKAVVDVTNMPEKTNGVVELQIDPSYTNIYAAGTSSLRLNIQMTGAWIPVADKLTLYYEDQQYKSVLTTQTTDLLQLDGTLQFKITDFMYSGLDLYFTFTEEEIAEHQSTGSCMFDPYKNYIPFEEYFDEEDEYSQWLLYDTEKQELPSWTPEGASCPVDFVAFYAQKKSQQNINFKKGTGAMLGDLEYTDGSFTYVYVTMEFEPKYNPFDESTE